MTSIVDSREIVQAFDISGIQECQIMHKLIRNINGKALTLDAGFNDRKLVSEISQLGIKPYIFPKKNNNINGDVYWQKMYLDFYYDTISWLKNYHQRSHTESFHSSFKRMFGIITKLLPALADITGSFERGPLNHQLECYPHFLSHRCSGRRGPRYRCTGQQANR